VFLTISASIRVIVTNEIEQEHGTTNTTALREGITKNLHSGLKQHRYSSSRGCCFGIVRSRRGL
jgi:hypothetical protein